MKTRTRVLAVIMTLAMILSSLVIVVPTSAATTDATPWHLSEDVATEFAGGSGTADDPYQIATAGQLAYLAKLTLEGTTDATNAEKPYRQLAYVVTADIDATAHQWTAIGANTNNDFEGTFDGGNYTIKTVLNDVSNSFYTTSMGHGGLFGRIQFATVKNVKLDFTHKYDARPTTGNNWFGFFSYAIYDGCTVDNCHVNMNVTGSAKGSQWLTGAFTGYFQYSTVTNYFTNCSVSGTMVVDSPSSSTPMAFASFFGAISGGAGGKGIIENCITTADITLKTCGHQDLLGSLSAKMWSGGAGEVIVNNYIDLSKISTTNATCYLHYGTLSSMATGESKHVFKVNGLVAGQTFQGLFSNPGSSGGKESISLLIAGSKITNPADNAMVFENVYTTNPLFPEFYTQAGSLTIDGQEAVVTGTNVVHDLDIVETATFDYEVDEEAGTIAITVPAGLYDIYDGAGIAAVGYGSKTTSEYTDNNDGTYTFVIATTERGAGYIKVDQAFDVETEVEDENGELVTETTAVKTGFVAAHHDMWKTYAVKTTFSSASGSPTVITTAEELAYLSYLYNTMMGGATPNSKTYYIALGDDIDLSHRNWIAIGQYNLESMTKKDYRFAGQILGNLYTIDGLTITDAAHADDEPACFLGAAKSPSKVEDLYMTNVYIDVTDVDGGNTASGVAAVVGFASGPTNLANVHVDGTINVVTNGESLVGGLVSVGNNVNLTNCSMSGSISVKSASASQIPCAGGLIGANQGYGTAESCVNNATITLNANTSNSIAGGIVGKVMGSIAAAATDSNANHFNVLNCVNTGDIIVKGTPNNHRIGGMVGNAGRGGKNGSLIVDGCINLGQMDVSAKGFKTGFGSGASQIVGLNEIYAHAATAMTLPKGLTVTNNYGLASATENNAMVVSPATVSVSNVAQDVILNGAKPAAAGAFSLADDGNTMLFEIATVENKVYVSATALDIFLNAGFEMFLVYGDEEITDTDDAEVEGDNYVWTFDAAADEAAALTLELYVGDMLEPVVASPVKATWAGMFAAEEFANDDPETDVIEIATAAELGLAAKLINTFETYADYKNAGYLLIDDIDLAGAEWTPIAPSHALSFTGTIDGNYKNISNMTLTAETYAYTQSFIGRAEGSFAMYNVTFVDPVIETAGVSVANNTIPAAVTAVGALYNGTLTNVDVEGLYLNVTQDGRGYVAGLVGYNCAVTAVIDGCDVEGVITGYNAEASAEIYAGLVARGRMGDIKNCIVDVDIDVEVNTIEAGSNYGGIVGIIQANAANENVVIENCQVLGSITAVSANVNDAGRILAVGGIVGRMTDKGSIVANNNVIAGSLAGVDNGETKADIRLGGAVGWYQPAAGSLIAGTIGEDEEGKAIVVEGGVNYILTIDKVAGHNPNKLEITGFTAWNVSVETAEQVALRIDTAALGNSGLRFTSAIDSELYAAMAADANVTVELGTIIAPLALMNAYGVEGLPTSVIVPYYVENYLHAGKGVDGFVAIEDGKNYFSGVIVDILEKNYDLDFSAAAYVRVTVLGNTYTIYGNATVEGRNVREIAQLAINDPNGGYTAEQIALLQMYLN